VPVLARPPNARPIGLPVADADFEIADGKVGG
jgi:hypothetical protein